MTTESPPRSVHNVSARSDFDVRMLMQQPNSKRLETSEDFVYALQIVPTYSAQTRRVAVVLIALAAMCLVMAGLVWWKLLT